MFVIIFNVFLSLDVFKITWDVTERIYIAVKCIVLLLIAWKNTGAKCLKESRNDKTIPLRLYFYNIIRVTIVKLFRLL